MDRELKAAIESMHRLNPEWKCSTHTTTDRVSFTKSTEDGIVSGKLEYFGSRNSYSGPLSIFNASVHYKINDIDLLLKSYSHSSFILFALLRDDPNVNFIARTVQGIFRKQGIPNIFETESAGAEALRKSREAEQKLRNKYIP